MTKDSESFFSRTLDKKTVEAREAVDDCLKQFLAPSHNKRQSAAQAAFAAVDRVYQLLLPNDRPAWLATLFQDISQVKSNVNDQNAIIAMQRIASEIYPQLLRHQWDVGGTESEAGFDFDAIYEKYRSECRIPELFDELIKYLTEIVASDDIDSVKALRELNKVIATLHAARNGSYFATLGAWNFVTRWFINTGWELLGSVPVVGSAFKGLQETLKETDAQMKSMHDGIQRDLEQQLASDFPRLEYRPPALPMIEGPKDGVVGSDPEAAT